MKLYITVTSRTAPASSYNPYWITGSILTGLLHEAQSPLTDPNRAVILKIVEKTALIITDGAENMRKTAESIAGTLKNCNVVSLDAKNFTGTQLLSADIYFFGAENPEPPSFSYLQEMLAHINLAGRPCGIFSGSEKAAGYLTGMVHDSELALHPDPYLGKGDIKAWTENVIKLFECTGGSNGA